MSSGEQSLGFVGIALGQRRISITEPLGVCVSVAGQLSQQGGHLC
jgi:hypothetical protein